MEPYEEKMRIYDETWGLANTEGTVSEIEDDWSEGVRGKEHLFEESVEATNAVFTTVVNEAEGDVRESPPLKEHEIKVVTDLIARDIEKK